MSFPDKGAVADIDPAFFVGYLHRQRSTGTLKFDDPPVQRAVYFRDGRILFSSSNAPEDQLGAILVAAGRITQEQFNAIVAGLEPKQSIAAALGQGGHVSQREIGDAARRKVEQIVAACCAQTGGRYDFENGALPKGALDLKLTTEKVLVSAFELLEPSGFLNRILKSPMAVLAPGTAEVTDPELMRVRDALDGVSSLADVGGAVGLPLAATEARAAVLVVLGSASVVTSQIEEMSLPDTGESSDGPAASELPDQFSEFKTSETVSFEPSAHIAASGGADATLMMGPSGSGEAAGGADATVLMGAGSTSDAEDTRMGGVKRERASTQDLAAVKELLGSATGPVIARPPAASMPSQRWEAKLSTQGRAKDHGKQGPLRWLSRSVVQGLAAFIALAVVGLTGWSYYTSKSGSGAGVAPIPASQGPPPSSSPAASGAPTVVPFAAPSAAASVALAGSPAATSSSAPKAAPSLTPLAAATKAALAVPPAPPTPTPSIASTAAPAKTTPMASVAAAPKVALQASGGALEALKAGRLPEAEAAFLSHAQARASEFSVQLLVACAPATIEKALHNDPSNELFILPATIAGKACHRLMRGFFETQPEAAEALSALPPYYRAEGAKPQAVALKNVFR